MCLAIIPPILRKIARFLSIHGSEKLGVFKQDFLFVGWDFPFCVASIKAMGGLNHNSRHTLDSHLGVPYFY
jgi:hypothetical protein